MRKIFSLQFGVQDEKRCTALKVRVEAGITTMLHQVESILRVSRCCNIGIIRATTLFNLQRNVCYVRSCEIKMLPVLHAVGLHCNWITRFFGRIPFGHMADCSFVVQVAKQ